MRIGLSSYTFPWTLGLAGQEPNPEFTVDTLIDYAAELGAGVVQLADLASVTQATNAQLSAWRTHATEVNISLEVGMRGIRELEISANLRVCEALGAPLLRTVIDREDDRPALDEARRLLTDRIPTLAAAGVRLAVENHDRVPAVDLAQLLANLDSYWIGSCLDTVNSLAVPEDPSTVVRALAPHVINLHAKDFTVRRANADLGFRVEGTPLGEGSLNLPQLIGALGGPQAEISVIIESWLPAQPSAREAWRTERRWADASVSYLREVLVA